MLGSVCEGLGMAVNLYMLGVRLGLLCSTKGWFGLQAGPVALPHIHRLSSSRRTSTLLEAAGPL